MKIKKKLVKVGSVLLLIVSIGESIYIFNYNKHKNEAISLVQNLTSNINPDTNLHEAYSKYFMNLNYAYHKTSEGDEIVNLTGRRHFPDREKICTVEINYLVDRNTGELKFHSAYIDGSKTNEIEILKMKIVAFSTVDSNSL